MQRESRIPLREGAGRGDGDLGTSALLPPLASPAVAGSAARKGKGDLAEDENRKKRGGDAGGWHRGPAS